MQSTFTSSMTFPGSMTFFSLMTNRLDVFLPESGANLYISCR